MPLPIDSVLPDLRAALVAHRFVVLEAPPGAGKTTYVPLALWRESWLRGQRIVMLEPRRLAARAAAHRMASLLGERVGETVGYRMRLDTRVSGVTRIEVVTEGVLTRMLQRDLALDGIGLVIFDEFHERSLAGDTGLALTLASAESLRDDLRILVMSATLQHAGIAQLLGGAPVIRATGRSWPVETRFAAPRPRIRFESHIAQVVADLLGAETGSLLVFLPGAGEIRRVRQQLEPLVPHDVAMHALHGSLPVIEQDAAIAPAAAGRRKVVLSTSIAETSLTIEGIRVVVDAGLMRIPRFSPRTGMTHLDTVRVSRASADQRRGRAGRLEPGICVRCWSGADDAGLVPYTRAEILDADLAPLLLDLASAGFADVSELRWLDPPPAAALAQGRELLQLLGAITPTGSVTPHGAAMAELGTHPRLAHLLIRARQLGEPELRVATILAALLEERDLLRGAFGAPHADVQLRIDAVVRDIDQVMLAGAVVDHGLVHRVRDAAADWARRLGGGARHGGESSVSAGGLLALAYPDRLAQRRDAAGRFVLRNGRGAMLPTDDPLAHADWLVAAVIDDAGRDGRIVLASAIDRDELIGLFGDQIIVVDDASWHDAQRKVTVRRRSMLGALIVREANVSDASPRAVSDAVLEGVRRNGVEVLRWTDASRGLRARLAFVHHHDGAWPDVGDAALLTRITERVQRGFDIADFDAGTVLLDLLDWRQRAALDTLAPERIEVPSGSRAAIDYSDPDAPVLAIRLQEVFGWQATPRILGERVPITMHLLSPAYRPVQVTRDLASFWRSGYFEVRKDLRGRYPKHHWPDDPLTAPAVRGARRRK